MISLISPIFFEELLTEGRYMGDTEKNIVDAWRWIPEY